MEKIWLKSYPEGVPAEIDPGRYRSLVHLLEEAFQSFATRTAYVCMGQRMSYAQLDSMSLRLAAWLQHKGLRKGARVAIMMPNLLQYPVVVAAILRAGCTVVNINPLYTPRELEQQLKDSGAEAIFILENFAVTLQQVIANTQVKLTVVAAMGDLLGMLKGALVNYTVRSVKKLVPAYALPGAIGFKQALDEGFGMTFRPVELGQEDIAFLQYTGGTTGVSKGAILTHRNLIANLLQNEAWIQPALRKEPKVEMLTFVCALPLYHIFALTVCSLVGTRLGAMNILIPNPRDLDGFIKTLSHYQVNLFPAVNTLYNGLVNHPEFAKLDFSRLKICNGGGMAVQKAVNDKWKRVTGYPIVEGYGLSETSPVVTANPADSTEYNGSIGLPLPSTEVAIVDEQGQPLPIGATGEIAIRGPQVMPGYWNNPLETAHVMTASGFFKSGDIGVMDERGYIRIVDRKKDMILVSGFNVYPNEVEAVATMHPDVLECACIGVPDEHTGEAVKLFVVRKQAALTEEQVREFCRSRLTAYKRPQHIEFRTELPKTNVGKILRRALREERSGTPG